MRERLHRVVGHRAAVIAAAHGRDRNVGCVCPLDGFLHGEVSADLPHRVVAVDDEGCGRVFHKPWAALGAHVALELLDVFGYAENAVRVDAPEVGVGKGSRQQAGVALRHAAASEDRGDQRTERSVGDTFFFFSSGISGHVQAMEDRVLSRWGPSTRLILPCYSWRRFDRPYNESRRQL